MQGWVLVLRGEVEAGVRQAEVALETLKSFPSRRFHLPIRIGIVGRAKAAAGDIDGALALFSSALEAASTTGERWYEPELLRLKAEMLLALPKPREGGGTMPRSGHCARAAPGGEVLGAESRSRARQICGRIRGGVMKDAISSLRSMPGSPKALTPPI